MSIEPSSPDASSDAPTRRDLLFITTGAMGVIAAGAALIPLVDQMNPDASAIAAGGPVDLNLDQVEPGSQVVVLWRSRPILVVFRTIEAIKALQDPSLLKALADPQSEQLQQPPYACHGSKYDLAGRVFRDVPAPYNLPVPPYRFLTDTTIRIGENPPNVDFDFSSIQQM